MRLLRFLIWLRKKRKPLPKHPEAGFYGGVWHDRPPEKKLPIYDSRGRCKSCGKPAETYSVRWL